jgi:hypothetical protein
MVIILNEKMDAFPRKASRTCGTPIVSLVPLFACNPHDYKSLYRFGLLVLFVC